MKFQITLEITPAGPFGVPQDGVTVLRGKEGGQYFGDIYHTATKIRVGYGYLPEYRTEEEGIDFSFALGNSQIHLHDNFAFVETEADTSREAYNQATKEIGKFLQHLSVSHGGLFTYRPLIIESDDGKLFPVPEYGTMGTVTIYNLERLLQDITDAQRYHNLSDQRLERALGYLGHARFLFAKRIQIANPFSEHFTMLIASIFLNLWKAASAIVGDPSKPEDSDYRQRYKKLGFDDEYFNTRIEKIRKLRNDYDVAHYTLADERINDIEKNFGEAEGIATEILKRYREFLLNASGGSQSQNGGSQSLGAG